VLSNDHASVLRALAKTDDPLILEEVAATTGLSFEDAWYAVLELIELRLMKVTGIGFYRLTVEGQHTARQLVAPGSSKWSRI
jgi:hypothetical protein